MEKKKKKVAPSNGGRAEERTNHALHADSLALRTTAGPFRFHLGTPRSHGPRFSGLTAVDAQAARARHVPSLSSFIVSSLHLHPDPS